MLSSQEQVVIKNMVCPRCINAVNQIFDQLGLNPLEVKLGLVKLAQPLLPDQRQSLKKLLAAGGFELLDDKQARLINRIKSIIIEQIHYRKEAIAVNFSTLLAQQLHYEYSSLSRLFSAVEGQTIERFIQAQKVEKVKELLTYDELTLSEIAFQLHYSSSAHLSTQFKKISGMTPSAFRKLQRQERKSLDEI